MSHSIPSLIDYSTLDPDLDSDLDLSTFLLSEVPASIQSMVDQLISYCSTGSKEGRVEAPSRDSGPASSSSLQLELNGQRFHVVTSLLILLKLLDEYLVLQESVPLFSSEVAHRATELLKTYNTTACQLVLGAGAMRTAGLKSISAKHLAVCSQAILMLSSALPFLRVGLTSPLPAQRQLLLTPEFDHLQQDLVLHVEEIHGKLVDIMQDRLQMAARQVVVEAETWGLQAPPSSYDSTRAPSSTNGSNASTESHNLPPSESIKSLAKQLNTLRTVLTPIIQQQEVQFIFGRVASMCSETLAATFDGLQFSNKGLAATWEDQRRSNATFSLQCLSELPMDPTLTSTFTSRMSTFCTKHYGGARRLQKVPEPEPEPEPAEAAHAESVLAVTAEHRERSEGEEGESASQQDKGVVEDDELKQSVETDHDTAAEIEPRSTADEQADPIASDRSDPSNKEIEDHLTAGTDAEGS